MLRFTVLLLATSACEPGDRGSAPLARADTLAIDRDRCIVPPGATDDPRLIAARCAELFAMRNGYTDLPPVADSAQWVWEGMGLGIEGRRNSLERRAHALCGDIRTDPAVLVVFRFGRGHGAPPGITETGEVLQQPPAGRAVVVPSDFSSMRFMHQDLLLPTPESKQFEMSCRILYDSGASSVPPAEQANAGDDPAP